VVISGYCAIGRRSFLGVNATFADHVSIPADTFVGLASVLNKSVEDPGQILTGNRGSFKSKRLQILQGKALMPWEKLGQVFCPDGTHTWRCIVS
jgi:carbonic anhydrase/acetyltransferase-like protein (isoleucine patch superfamily)